MKVLWLVSIVLPEAARALGLGGNPAAGWLIGQREQLKREVSLVIAAVDARVRQIRRCQVDGVDYLVYPRADKEDFRALLAAERPDVVHLWGSEYEAVCQMGLVAPPERTLLSAQGLMVPYTEHLLDGVPARYCRSGFLQRAAARITPGELLDRELAFYKERGKRERELLAGLRYVTGRTAWDRAWLERLAPAARYFVCNETLRPGFFTAQWQGPPTEPVLFVSQGNVPRKGLHRLLEALPAVRKEFPTLTVQVAGWPLVKKGPLLEPLLRLVLPYQTYLKERMHALGLEKAVTWLGPLNEGAMRQALLGASVYCMPSSIENSPNSLGEAMLLGLPCVASTGGGTPSMLQSGEEGLLVEPQDRKGLAEALLAFLRDPALAARCGQAARQRALRTHDPAANGRAMLHIYETISREASHAA